MMEAVLFAALKIVLMVAGVLGVVAYLTYGERRVLARLQVRVGPNRVGPLGLLQPLADGVKLIGKEILTPAGADRVLFRLAPLMIMTPALLVYAFIPLGPGLVLVDANAGLLMLLAISSLGVYGIMVGGWSSNNKYSAMGALRSAAQLISYEVSLMLAAMAVIVTAGSMNISSIVESQETLPLILTQPLAFLIFLIAGVAETNRVPFDLPEAEAELTGGYHTEYSGIAFGMFFMAEYANVLTLSLLTSLLFLGGWNGPFLPGPHWLALKTLLMVFFLFWTRGTQLRLRYDQLMAFGWKVLFPAATLNFLVTGLVKVLR
jgi:NADH-quinone oxidoreductase subunit H